VASFGTVSLADVWRALDACLPGYRRVEKKHHWWVYPPVGEPYRSLPLGEHGSRRNVSIERGHVRKLGRQFAVLDCLEAHVPGL